MRVVVTRRVKDKKYRQKMLYPLAAFKYFADHAIYPAVDIYTFYKKDDNYIRDESCKQASR